MRVDVERNRLRWLSMGWATIFDTEPRAFASHTQSIHVNKLVSGIKTSRPLGPILALLPAAMFGEQFWRIGVAPITIEELGLQ